MSNDYQFTKDWFSWAPPVWEQLIPMLPETTGYRTFLEIGSFEGRSAIWIAENMMRDGDHLFCVDTWGGGEEHTNGELSGAEERFRHNLNVAAQKLPDRRIFQAPGTSTSRLAAFIQKNLTFDFIYIDGSHTAPDVLTDACMAWPLLMQDGIMVFDDYLWGPPRDALHRPKLAIDSFVNIFAEQVDVLHCGYQFVVRKK